MSRSIMLPLLLTKKKGRFQPSFSGICTHKWQKKKSRPPFISFQTPLPLTNDQSLSVEDSGLYMHPWFGQTKDWYMVSCFFSYKELAIRSTN